jgi:hypothetical protein
MTFLGLRIRQAKFWLGGFGAELAQSFQDFSALLFLKPLHPNVFIEGRPQVLFESHTLHDY